MVYDDEEYFFFESPLVKEGPDQKAVTEWVHRLKAEFIASVLRMEDVC